MKMRNWKWKKGSFTVEASFLLPFLVLLLFVFLCLGLYMHDRSVLSACAAELSGKGAVKKYQSEEALEGWLKLQAEELAKERVLTVRNVEAFVEVTEEEVQITYQGDFPLLRVLSVCEREKARRENPVVYLRRLRNFKNLKESGLGKDERK